MKKLLLFFLCFVFLFANEFSKMSTQELISVMGYVKPAKEVQFLRELESRVSHMDEKTKRSYKENLKKYYKIKK